MKCLRCGDDENRIDGYCSIYCRDMAEAEAEIAALREANRWIPVSERMPEAGRTVLVYSETYGITSGVYDGWVRDGWPIFVVFEGKNEVFQSARVTHWMPLPEPPAHDAGKDERCLQ